MTLAATLVDSHPARVAELWLELIAAADAGDERAGSFLQIFGPWAQAELELRPTS